MILIKNMKLTEADDDMVRARFSVYVEGITFKGFYLVNENGQLELGMPYFASLGKVNVLAEATLDAREEILLQALSKFDLVGGELPR